MIFTKILISILITWMPLMIDAQNKIFLIIPRHVRRVQNSGLPSRLRQLLRQNFIKPPNFLDNEFLQSHSHPRHYTPHSLKNSLPSSNKNLPHGGDDFDQGHEKINHIMVPHGKDISHGISFGKGYVPHDALIHHAGFKTISNNHHDINQDSSSYSLYKPNYAPLYLTQQADSYFHHQNHERDTDEHQYDEQERRADELSLKYLNVKSIGKIKNNYNNEKSLITPRSTLQPSISSRNTEFILQDTIALDDYSKQVLELTNTWPKSLNSPTTGVLSTDVRPQVISQYGGASQPLISHPLDLNNIHGHTQFSSSFIPATAPQHQHSGYAVKEDIEDIPHDFRTMPIQTGSEKKNYQQQLPINVQSFQNNNALGHHHSLSSNIQTQSQAIPGYYALAGLTGISNT